MIKRNRARCKNCGVEVESKYRHDWVSCPCFDEDKGTGIFVDGGKDYLRRGGKLEDIIELSEEE